MASLKILLTGFIALSTIAACTSKEKGKKLLTALPFTDLSLKTLDEFRQANDKSWSIAGNVYMNRQANDSAEVTKGEGVLVNLPGKEGKSNMVTKLEHGDIDLHLDFMLAKGSVAGVYFQGRYAVLLPDSGK